ncbi:MAG: hypothetical protein WC455_12085 [Dehalococcoidia bacterium]|jgi:hypothetical protein
MRLVFCYILVVIVGATYALEGGMPKQHPIGYAVKCDTVIDPGYASEIAPDTFTFKRDTHITCDTTWFKIDMDALRAILDSLLAPPRFEGFRMRVTDGISREDWPKGATHYTIYCSGGRCDTLWTYPIVVDTIVRCDTTYRTWHTDIGKVLRREYTDAEIDSILEIVSNPYIIKCDTTMRRRP